MDGACQARQRAPGRYQPRRPSESVLYRCVQGHFETWLAHGREGHDDAGPVNPHLHFHCVVIDGVFDAAAAGGVIFHAATGLDAQAFADVQARLRGRLLRVFVRRGLLAGDDARAMAQWEHGGGFSVDGSVRIEAADRAGRERLLRNSRPAAVRPATAHAKSMASTSSTRAPSPARAGPARCASALLLVRLYEVFPLVCPRCGAEMRIIAFLTEPVAVRAILAHPGEPTAPPRIAPARGPPLGDLPDAGPGDFDPHAQPAPEYEFDQRLAW